MSKKNVATEVAVDLNLKKRRALVIIIISLLTAIILTVSIILAVYEAPAPDFNNPTYIGGDESSLEISNGDFAFVKEEGVLAPLSAKDWNVVTLDQSSYDNVKDKYTDFIIGYNQTKATLGIINVDQDVWATVSQQLALSGVSVSNPNSPEDIDDDGVSISDTNVYMIHHHSAYASSIYSDSVAFASSTYNKVSVKIKLQNVTGDGAFVMIKKIAATSSNSALENSSTGVAGQQWLAYQLHIDQATFDAMSKDANGYATVTLYVFNLSNVSATTYVQVGLGDVYNYTETNATAGSTGTLFVDEIRTETCTAAEYVEHRDDGTTAYTIASTDTDDYSVLASSAISASTTSFDTYKNDAGNAFYSNGLLPFIAGAENHDGTIYYTERLSASDTSEKSLSFDLGTIAGPDTNDCYHVTFWMRVVTPTNNAKAVANIYVVDEDGNYTLLQTASAVKNEDLEDDHHNGWKQYHLYIQPGNIDHEVTVEIFFGDKTGYVADSGNPPVGKVLLTEVKYEKITRSAYESSSKSGMSINLGSTTNATTSVTNGSFNSLQNLSALDARLPSSWSFVYAGQNTLTRDPASQIEVAHHIGASKVEVLSSEIFAPSFDDGNKNVLKITNNVATTAGVLSSSITIPAHSYTVLTVYAKGEGNAVPYIYLYDVEDYSIIASVQGVANNDNLFLEPLYAPLDDPDQNNGFVKYHIFVVTGDTSMSVAFALFNGALNEDCTSASTQEGTVYFDLAAFQNYSTYVRTYEYNDDQTDYIYDENGNVKYEDEVSDDLDYAIGLVGNVYGINTDNGDTYYLYDNVTVLNNQSVLDAPEIEIEEDEDDKLDTPTTDSKVDAGLILSIISSSLLVCALLIVIVVKFFPVTRRRAL
ncbi:MAG: hypothetical protein J6R37_00025 [Clostridia bacterium]|nr:hypothetical protein [Clostridia bacterium]